MAIDRTAFQMAVTKYCEAAGASETSGYRTPLHNRRVGGIEESPHLLGLGRDVVYDGSEITHGMRERLAAELGLELVHESDHDHVQPAGWGAGKR